MFYVTVQKSDVGKFTEGKQYPVIDVSNITGFGVQFLIPDDTGDMRYYKYELCKYAEPSGSAGVSKAGLFNRQ